MNIDDIMKFEDWIPIDENNRYYVESQQGIGMMRTTIHEEGGVIREYARFTPIGYRTAKRHYIFQKGGIRKFLLEFLNLIDYELSLGDRLIVGDLKK